MTHQQARNAFVAFFERVGHMHIPADSLVPSHDPSVLFTVAGMQQFKDFYQRPQDAPAPRVVTIQPCVRTVDIDEIGDDTHSTVFEMLGNFSFGFTKNEIEPSGPYFKPAAIRLAWEFLTDVLDIEAARVSATYFGGDSKRPLDAEASTRLKQLKGLSLIEAKGDDNFWGPVGDEGPCGPTVEFYVDGVEVWNLVFNSYWRDATGGYSALENQGVDTGMGLERLLKVLQRGASIYDTDLHAPFMDLVRRQAYNQNERLARVVTDHVKAALFLLTDGVKPGNKGRDYVLRRLIRRAVRSGQLLGLSDFGDLLKMMVAAYGPYYASMATGGEDAVDYFRAEQVKFERTLNVGLSQLTQLIGQKTGGEITGADAFRLFETFGFPVELTQEIAQERGWTVDMDGFLAQQARHRERSRVGLEKIFKGGLADDDPQTVAHHTAHHLLLAALRQVLGSHVVQRGSNITRERLRLDVTHPTKISDEELRLAEAIVNQAIDEDLPVVSEIMDRDAALKLGALAEFGAKYPPKACVYSIIGQDGGVFSREFCGGPHVMSTGELGKFEIIKEESAGAGIRRLRARVLRPETKI